jgi:hypothetical protein
MRWLGPLPAHRDRNTPWLIYGLFAPGGRCRYIGVTRGELEARYRQHLSLRGGNPAKKAWIAGLLSRGRAPAMRVLGSIRGTYLQAQHCEAILSRSLQEHGCCLLNREARYRG